MRWAINRSTSGGFPHSDILGSKGALASPRLIAECHVLHRLLPPRHPPNALLALDPSQKTVYPLLALTGLAEGPPGGGALASDRSRSVSLDLERHVSRSQPPRGETATDTYRIASLRCERPLVDRCDPKGPNEWAVVGVGGLEPPTLRLSGVRSNHLSYTPRHAGPKIRAVPGPSQGGPAARRDCAEGGVVEPDGIEPTT